MPPELGSPWKEFLLELDQLLTEPLQLHCMGGFAVVAAYGLPRSTNDLDYFRLIPYNCDLESIAGQGSALAKKHRVHVHRAAVASVRENYDDRLTKLFPGTFKKLGLFVLDPYDLVLSKLSRNSARDHEDVKHLAKKCFLDANVLRDRYQRELRAIQIGDVEDRDQALEFWIEAYFAHV